MMHDAPTVNGLTTSKFGIRRLHTGDQIYPKNLEVKFGELPNNHYQILKGYKFGSLS